MSSQKHSAKYVCRIGTSASSTVSAVTSCEMIRKRTRSTSSEFLTSFRFPRDDTKENKRYLKFTLDLFSIPNYYIKKGRPHGHRYGNKEGDHEYFIRDERFRESMIELGRTGEVLREMDKIGEGGSHTPRYCRRN